ncbi:MULTISPECIES: DeoR/GlpR family DNA-binding transcription regulator [unclassified Rathayibacter]|uniref:DeoR/GlpR family DNA-binding transcription regulator n=1 Tax=unclassified Rathayibacter TaxID=2609250 RepID=UPI0007015AA9|nr:MULTISPECIES: DeoR/GlpR family DNA-binding transcription regulator [unclassified Rathayibacter]KQQ03336.1 DeoR family transcriptional regulator [Rathayibacter sp. Leaf294]KQS11790.1 DeoR family transcriptional regulator [Rathayibacter sp. Leaf185]
MATVDSAERRARLIGLLERDGAIRLDDAAAELDVSTMTVRRDLADLEAEGRLSRVRGGAVAALRPRPFAERLAAGAAAKRGIARKAVALLPASGAVAVDASSTAGTFLGAAPESPALLIATNSLENHASARATRARVVLIGGELEEETDSFVGPLACASAAELHYDRFFTSASAVSITGTSEVTLQEAQVKRVFVAASSETVLLVDSSKLERSALARALDWAAISVMVTELDPSDERLEPFRGLVELR